MYMLNVGNYAGFFFRGVTVIYTRPPQTKRTHDLFVHTLFRAGFRDSGVVHAYGMPPFVCFLHM